MVRKIITLFCALCVCLTMSSNAFAYTSYDQGTMSTTYVQYFRDIVDGLPSNYSYVATRSGQYEYILHASDNLKYGNDQYLSDNGITYTITVGSGYNSTYDYDVSHEQNFVLYTNGQMVYSSIGDYPSLDERGSVYEYSLLVAVIVCCICLLIRPIFKYVLRIR